MEPWSEAWGVERACVLWPVGPGRKFETALPDVTQSMSRTWGATMTAVAGRGGVGRRAGAGTESGPEGGG